MCDHIDALVSSGFLVTGSILNYATGETTDGVPVLRELKEGKDGIYRCRVGGKWVHIEYCPLCGEKTAP